MDDDRSATSYTFGSLLVRTGAVLAAFIAPVAFGAGSGARPSCSTSAAALMARSGFA